MNCKILINLMMVLLIDQTRMQTISIGMTLMQRLTETNLVYASNRRRRGKEGKRRGQIGGGV